MSDKTGGPAFPTESEAQTGRSTWRHEGMTLRDYFAAKAMQGILSNPDVAYDPKDLAKVAVEYAEAMLAEREKSNG